MAAGYRDPREVLEGPYHDALPVLVSQYDPSRDEYSIQASFLEGALTLLLRHGQEGPANCSVEEWRREVCRAARLFVEALELAP